MPSLPAPNPPPPTPLLDEETTDDLLYAARTNDLDLLLQTLNVFLERQTQQQSQPQSEAASASTPSPLHILATARDEYTGNGITHLAAANGCCDVLSFVLGLGGTDVSLDGGARAGRGCDDGENSGMNNGHSTSKGDGNDRSMNDENAATARAMVVVREAQAQAHARERSQTQPVGQITADAELQILITTTNAAGNTPLHYAALNAQVEAVKMLVESLPPSSRNAGTSTEEHTTTTRADFVQARNEANRTAAEEAAAGGREGWEAVVGFLEGVVGVSEEENDDQMGEGRSNDTSKGVREMDEEVGEVEREGGMDMAVDKSAKEMQQLRVGD